MLEQLIHNRPIWGKAVFSTVFAPPFSPLKPLCISIRRLRDRLYIDWSAVKFDQDVIVLSKAVTKTNTRRLVPLLPNLKRWLLPYKDSTGNVAERWSSPNTMCKAWTEHAKNVGVVYKKNGMRNSFISYRLAVVKNIAQVALESGNSPAIIQREYLELATEADGKRWFAIAP